MLVDACFYLSCIAFARAPRLPLKPRELRWYVYNLTERLRLCETVDHFAQKGLEVHDLNFAEHGSPIERMILSSGWTTPDPREAHLFYLPACLIRTYFVNRFYARSGRRTFPAHFLAAIRARNATPAASLRRRLHENSESWIRRAGSAYESALVDVMNSVGPFWANMPHRHVIHAISCSAGHPLPARFSDIYPRMWRHTRLAISSPIRICFEVPKAAATLKTSEDVFLPYHVPKDVHSADAFVNGTRVSRSITVLFRGSLCCGREWVRRIRVIPQARLALFTRSDKTGASKNRALNVTFSNAQFALAPLGDTVHRRATFEAIAAGAVPLMTHGLQVTTWPFAECVPGLEEAMRTMMLTATDLADERRAQEKLASLQNQSWRFGRTFQILQSVLDYTSTRFADCFAKYSLSAARLSQLQLEQALSPKRT